MSHPWGHEVIGQVMYGADGYMAGSFSRANRTPFAAADLMAGTPSEFEAAMKSYVGYAGSNGSTEIMIWTDNYNQVPSGSVVETTTVDERTYRVHKAGSYIAFVDSANVSSGTIDILAILNHVIAKGWIPTTSTLGQIDYGIELVSTDGKDATFQLYDFSIVTH